MVGLFIPCCSQKILCGKSLPLVNRVIEFGVGVAHLGTVDIKLKTLHLGRVIRFFLGQGRNLNGMIHHEGRLNHLMLAEFIKKEIFDIAFFVMWLIGNLLFICHLFCRLCVRNLIKVNATGFLDRLYHGDPAKRFAKINDDRFLILSCCFGLVLVSFLRRIPVNNGGCPEHFFCHMAVHGFRQIHHAVIIGVGLIKLHQCKFRIVLGVQPLIPEDAADLVNPLHASDNQSLQIQLQRNAQFNIFIQCVVVGLERSGCRTACIGHQHGSLHLQKALSVEITPDGGNDFGSQDKGPLAFLIHDQIDITLPVAQICIGKTMELFRENLQRFGKKSDFFGMNGNFSRLCFKDMPLDPDDVADVKLLECLIGFRSNLVPGHIALNVAFQILYIAKRRLAHDALAHHSSGNGHLFIFPLGKMILNLFGMMRLVEFYNLKRIRSRLLQFLQLISSDLPQTADFLL